MTPEFEELVRDALHHLYDLSHLQTHPLSAMIGEEQRRNPAGRMVRQALLDAIESLNPGPGATSRAHRSYRILELRFIEEHDIGDVIQQVALSKSQYHRAQSRAINAVASYLWERWRIQERRDLDPRSLPAAEPSAMRAELEGFGRADSAPDLDFKEVLRQVAELLSPLERQHGVSLGIEADQSIPIVRGSRVMLRQALLAVLSHAIVASRSPRVQVAVQRRGLEVELSVAGESEGPVTEARLGLNDGAPFVDGLAGTIALTARACPPGAWIVTLRFPARYGPLLLVVDNDRGFVELIRRYLADEEWRIVGASTADEALELIRVGHPAAIVLDLVLPDRDGWELLLDLRRHTTARDVPVVVCSALDESDMARSLGAAAFLRKPVTQAEVMTALAALPTRQPTGS